MADKTFESVVEGLDEADRKLVTDAIEKVKTDAQKQINDVRSDLDGKLSEANKRADDAEFDLAGRDGSVSGRTTELTTAQQRLVAQREAAAKEAERAATDAAKDEKIAEFEKRFFDSAVEAAKSSGVPEAILATCKTEAEVKTAVLTHEHYGNGKTSTNGGGGGARPGTTVTSPGTRSEEASTGVEAMGTILEDVRSNPRG